MDDAVLLERVLGGDGNAFRELVIKYQDPIVRLARYYVGSDASAEDVAQETWIAVLKGLERFEVAPHSRPGYFASPSIELALKESEKSVWCPWTSRPDRTLLAGRFNQGGMWSDPPIPFTDNIDDALDQRPPRARWCTTPSRDFPRSRARL